MRVSNDHTFRVLQMWQAGLLDQLPACTGGEAVPHP